MGYRSSLACMAPLLALSLGCDPGMAPPGGTYLLTLDGLATTILAPGGAPTEEPLEIDSSAAVYVDVGAGGNNLDLVWNSQGLNAPRNGRLFEMRLFPYTFENDGSTATLAGVFDDDVVEAVGIAYGTGSYVTVQFPDEEEPTLCAYYERRREILILGSWAGDEMDVTVDALYQEACLDTAGNIVRDGYPEIRYDLSGTLINTYDPFAQGGEQ